MIKYFIVNRGRTTTQIKGEIFQHGDRWFGLDENGNCTDLLTGMKVLMESYPGTAQATAALEDNFTLLVLKQMEKNQPEKYKSVYNIIKACYSPGSAMYRRLYKSDGGNQNDSK